MNEEYKAKFEANEATRRHSIRVGQLLLQMIERLHERILSHDASKFEEPELSVFAEYTPKLKNCTYGSDEYKRYLKEMNVALEHHYAVNRHHPEHHNRGVNDMTLVDLIEMICDWRAAAERHADGDIQRSIGINTIRFDLSPQLVGILRNTANLFNTGPQGE